MLYSSFDKAIWASDTKGKKGVRLIMQDDRNLVLYAADGAAWSTKTDTDAPPPAPAGDTVKATDTAPRTYTAVSGDTLFKIAERFYGDGNRYPEIAKASGIANPDLIMPGQELTIPQGQPAGDVWSRPQAELKRVEQLWWVFGTALLGRSSV